MVALRALLEVERGGDALLHVAAHDERTVTAQQYGVRWSHVLPHRRAERVRPDQLGVVVNGDRAAEEGTGVRRDLERLSCHGERGRKERMKVRRAADLGLRAVGR